MAFTYKSYEESDEVKRKRQEAEAHKNYVESQSVTDSRNAMKAHDANKVSPWTGGTYGDSLKQAMNKITNREKFSYDLNGDALYQQYKDRYINQGKMAMMDTVGQASALTGGYGNSYAVTAGNQAYQESLKGLNDIVPELYQLAYDKYNREGEELYNQYSLINNAYNTEYGEYRDKVADWNTEAERLSNRYYNEANMDYSRFSSDRDYYTNAYNNERTTDYGRYSDDYNRAFSSYQQQVSEEQAARQYALQQAQLAEQIRSNKANEAISSARLKAEQAQAKEVTPKKTQNAIDYGKNNIIDRKWWGTGMTSADERKYGTYDNYVAEKIYNGVKSYDLTEQEAKYLLDVVYKIDY